MDCCLCRTFGSVINPAEPYDHILFESTNFVIVPTAGSIIPGWLLIIPRQHFICLGAMSEPFLNEMESLHRLASYALRGCFGPVVAFEHGPQERGKAAGCGVDHAHLHVVATEIDLVAGANAMAKENLVWKRIHSIGDTISYHRRGMQYLYVEQPEETRMLCELPSDESQLMRRVVATASGKADSYDWKHHTFDGNVLETIERIEQWKLSGVQSRLTT